MRGPISRLTLPPNGQPGGAAAAGPRARREAFRSVRRPGDWRVCAIPPPPNSTQHSTQPVNSNAGKRFADVPDGGAESSERGGARGGKPLPLPRVSTTFAA